MKPDTYFRHAGRPPCTQNATDASGSASPHSDSNAAQPDGHTLQTAGETEESPKSGEILSTISEPLSPKRRGRPRKSP